MGAKEMNKCLSFNGYSLENDVLKIVGFAGFYTANM